MILSGLNFSEIRRANSTISFRRAVGVWEMTGWGVMV
jgi:hypothetical protein